MDKVYNEMSSNAVNYDDRKIFHYISSTRKSLRVNGKIVKTYLEKKDFSSPSNEK